MSNDLELLSRVAAGTSGAFTELVQRHQKLVWSMVYRMVQQPQDTQEISQEVFLKVHQNLHQFRNESALSTWIGRIAFTTAARHLQRRRLPLVYAENENDTAFVEQVSDDFDLETALGDADLIEKMTLVMETLPALPRTLLTLYYLNEMSISEISQITEMPAGTIKSHLYRARQLLNKKMTDVIGETV